MKVDYISDLHIDMYIDYNESVDDIIRIFNQIIAKDRKIGDVLVIAGDLGHYNNQSIEFLKYLRKNYYKNIMVVLGNHDYYLFGKYARTKYKNSFERVSEMRDLINVEEGLYCLNGNIIEIDDVKFAGCDSWYDGSYLNHYHSKQYATKEQINNKWKSSMNDARQIVGVESIYEIFKIEKKKLENIYQKCDVLVTHVNPLIKQQHLSSRYEDRELNAFYCFDGDHYLKETTAKYWIFGHSHGLDSFEKYNTKCLINTMGYPYESANGRLTKMKSFNYAN